MSLNKNDMKKIVKLTEGQLLDIIKQVIKESEASIAAPNPQTTAPNQFKAQATVEGDMVMSFPVTGFSDIYGTITMEMIDPVSKEKLYVSNFRGAIYKENNTKKYTQATFTNIGLKNYNDIWKKYNIPGVIT
jgi:hypothetical protein